MLPGLSLSLIFYDQYFFKCLTCIFSNVLTSIFFKCLNGIWDLQSVCFQCFSIESFMEEEGIKCGKIKPRRKFLTVAGFQRHNMLPVSLVSGFQISVEFIILVNKFFIFFIFYHKTEFQQYMRVLSDKGNGFVGV